jgi:hypothetical protein
VGWSSKFKFHGRTVTPFYGFGGNDDAALGGFVLRFLANSRAWHTLVYYFESRRFDGFKTNVAAVQSEKKGW